MAVIKLEALQRLKEAIEVGVPELCGRIHAGVSPPNHRQEFPCLTINVVGRWRYEPEQEQEFSEPAVVANTLVVCVGEWQGTIQLVLQTATLDERYVLEQQLTDLFLSTEGHPGVLLTVVTNCPELGDFLASWEFDDVEWDDEMVFDARIGATIVCTGLVPALITRGDVHTITDLRLGLGDLGSNSAAGTFVSTETVAVVSVSENGDLTKV